MNPEKRVVDAVRAVEVATEELERQEVTAVQHVRRSEDVALFNIAEGMQVRADEVEAEGARLTPPDRWRTGRPVEAPSVLGGWARTIATALDAQGVNGRGLAAQAGIELGDARQHIEAPLPAGNAELA